jgi:drug/metabolite transporter (DMT)-like permease
MILTATAMWGSEGLPVRIATRNGLPPEFLALMRTGVATLLLAGVALFRDPSVLRPRRSDSGLLAFNGLLGVAICATGASIAMARIPIALTFLLINTAPLWVMAFSRVFRGEPVTRLRLVAAGLGLCGVWIALGVGTAAGKALDPLGAAAALVTGFSYAVYVYNGSRATGRIGRFRLYVQTFVWGFAALALAIIPSRGLGPILSAPLATWLSAAYLGIFPTVGAFGLLMLALKRISGTAAAIGSMAEIPFSMFWSWIFLGERVGLSAALGGILIVASVVLISTEPAPEPFPAGTQRKT